MSNSEFRGGRIDHIMIMVDDESEIKMDKEQEALMANLKKEVQVQTLKAVIELCQGLINAIIGDEDATP